MLTLQRVLGLLSRLIGLLVRALRASIQFWAKDMRSRTTMLGKATSLGIGLLMLSCICALPLSLLSPRPRPTSVTASAAYPVSASAALASNTATTAPAVTSTTAPTATLQPTPTIEPTATPLAPPVARAEQMANLRNAPRVAEDTAFAVLCPGDTLDYVSVQQVGDERWFRVRVAAAGDTCDARRAAVGTEGWAAASVVSAPSYAVERYAEQHGITLPTAILSTPIPTRAPTARPAPQPAVAQTQCDPSYPDFCLEVGIADLDCGDIPYRRFRVVGRDPHRFDGDRDGVGCER